MTEISNTVLFVLIIVCLVLILLLLFLLALCFPWCCPIIFSGYSRRKHLQGAINEFLKEPHEENKVSINQVNDLENQVGNNDPQNNADAASNVALNSFPMNSTNSTRPPAPPAGSGSDSPAADSDSVPDGRNCDLITATGASETASQSALDITRDLDFKSVLEEYLSEDGFEEPVVQTIVANPVDHNADLVNEYDTYSRTILLQLLNEACRKPDEQIIREVSDPFLQKFIKIGEKVVVVKPFIGKNDCEFASLQTGDLIRIIKFNIADTTNSDGTGSIKSIQIGSAKTKSKPTEVKVETKKQTEYQADEITIYKTDPNHEKITCTGILLDTYLDFNSHNNELKLKVRDQQENDGLDNDETIPFELIKEFPLNIVSLETTVVKTALFGDSAGSETEY